jgi:cytochrome c
MGKAPIRLTTIFWLLGIGAVAAYGWRRMWSGRRYHLVLPMAAPSDRSQPESGTAAGSGMMNRAHRDESAGQVASASTGKLPRFLTLLLVLGGVALLVVLGDLILRGFWREIEPPVWETSREDVNPGRQAIIKYGCGGCHVIPGIRHATGRVGPQLHGFRDQMYIGGVLPNVPENLVAWIQNPPHFNPRTAMPNLHVTEEEARAIAIYIYAQP